MVEQNSTDQEHQRRVELMQKLSLIVAVLQLIAAFVN